MRFDRFSISSLRTRLARTPQRLARMPRTPLFALGLGVALGAGTLGNDADRAEWRGVIESVAEQNPFRTASVEDTTLVPLDTLGADPLAADSVTVAAEEALAQAPGVAGLGLAAVEAARAMGKLVPEGPIVVRDLGVGHASYYGARFAGRRTANGERFDPNAMTAAHKRLPFGTLVRVTNTRNGRSVVVRINDRGPYIRGRVIDLSREAARRIGLVQSGVAAVRMEIVERPEIAER